MSRLAIAPSDIERAARRIDGLVRRTPIVPLDGTPLLLKLESLQEGGSFKLRGATNAISQTRAAGVIAASSGNHGRAVAIAARRAGIAATVVMTTDSRPSKRSAVTGLGARVVDCEPGSQARERLTAELATAQGLALIPAYDHPLTIAGQGTAGMEIAVQAPGASAVVVPLGGGGLLSGTAIALRGRGFRGRIVGVEPQAGDDTVRSLRAGRRVSIDVPTTICDGARLQCPGELTFPIVQELVDEVITVTDAEVLSAMRRLIGAGLWVEPTGALAVAGALRLSLGWGTVCLVSGRNASIGEMVGMLGPTRASGTA